MSDSESEPEKLAKRVQRASRERRARNRSELREKILRAAGELFVEGGYEGLSMRQLAERVGYTAPTIYAHFASKDDLLFELLDEGYTTLGQQLAAAATADLVPLDRIVAIGRAYIAFGLANQMHYQLMFMRRADFLQSRLAARDKEIDPFRVIQTAVQAAIDAGDLPVADPLEYSLLLWSVVHGVVGLFLIAPVFDPELTERVTKRALQTMREGLAR